MPQQGRVFRSLFFLWCAVCFFSQYRVKAHSFSAVFPHKTPDLPKDLFHSLLFCEIEEKSVLTPYGAPIFDESFLQSEWERIEKAPFSERELLVFINDVSSSVEKKKYFGRVVRKLFDFKEANFFSNEVRERCKTFLADAPEVFRSFVLDMLTYFVKTHRGYFEDLSAMLKFSELLPLHQAYIVMNLFINRDFLEFRQSFREYFSHCSEEEKKILLQNVPKKSIDGIKPYLNSDEIPLIERECLSRPDKSGAEILQEEPLIYLYREVLNATQINTIINTIKLDSFKEAESINSNGAKGYSRIAKITPLDGFSELEEMIFHIFETRLRVSRENVEGLDLVYYPERVGRFNAHYDAFDDSLMEKRCLIQRRATAIFYLNSVKKGGETVFQKVFITPEEGSLLFFENIDLNGNPVNEHAGHPTMDPVGKWIVVAHILKSFEERTEKEKYCAKPGSSFAKKIDFEGFFQN